MLFGLASEGGEYGAGAIIMANGDGSELEVSHSFHATIGKNPMNCQLVEAADGKLYGMTLSGGAWLKGVLFSYDPSTGAYEIHVNFDGTTTGGHAYSGLTLASDGKLYGMTSAGGTNNEGVIFSFDPSSKEFVNLHNFEAATGSQPTGSLIESSDGLLYGVTNSGGIDAAGVIFKFNPEDGSYTKLRDFSTEGRKPFQGFIAVNDKFYGMTSQGGTNDDGVIYEYSPADNSVVTLHNFSMAEGATPLGVLTAATNGKLYGMTLTGGANSNGVIFEFDLSNNDYNKLFDFNEQDGIAPYGSLFQAADGKLYGVTEQGNEDKGGLFEYDLTSGTFTNIISFYDNDTGATSRTTLMQAANGKLYGMTSSGGLGSEGVLFEFDPATHAYAKKVEMGVSVDGRWPQGDLVQADNGKLYGTSYNGGVSRVGVFFEFDITNQSFSKKFDFDVANGTNPVSTLLAASNGKLYGFAGGGGVHNRGVLYEYDPATANYTKKYDFMTETGSPVGGPVQVGESKIYGVTNAGGANDNGILFEFDFVTGEFAKKADFDNTATGRYPLGTLLLSDNKLFGLTERGGVNDIGVLFEYDLQSGALTKRVDFDEAAKGAYPKGKLVLVDGKIYGHTNYGGEFGSGVIFEYDPATTNFTRKYSFDDDYTMGADVVGGLVQSGNGKLYAATAQGGLSNLGAFYEFDIANGTYTKKHDLTGLNGARVSGAFIFVSMEPQNLVFNALTEKTFGDVSFDLSATSDTDTEITFASSNPNVASVSGATITIHGAGTTTITASQQGSKQYHSATVERTLVVNKAPQSITFESFEEKTFGDASFSPGASSSVDLPIVYTSSNHSVATIDGETIIITGAGSTVITASQPGNNNYLPAADVEQTLIVNKKAQTITMSEFAEWEYRTDPFTLDGNASSGLALTYQSSNEAVATIEGNVLTVVGVGSTEITASQSGNDNYLAADNVIRPLTIVKANQVIDFAALEDRGTLDEPFQLNASASSLLPVTFTSSNELVASVEGSVVTINGTGVTSITASQAGDAHYNAAEDVVRELNVLLITGADDPIAARFEIYPNPVNDNLFIKMMKNAVDLREVVIIDQLGRRLTLPIVKSSVDGMFECSTTTLTNGIYVLFVAGEKRGRMIAVSH